MLAPGRDKCNRHSAGSGWLGLGRLSDMQATKPPRVKICCIASHDEATLAIEHRAAALGLVSAMPSGPGVISEPLIARIAAGAPSPVATFLLTARHDAQGIIAQHHRCRTSTIQIVDRLTHGSYHDLRRALPGISIVQVVHVVGEESIEEAALLDVQVDAILLDSGNPALATKELGGTGRRHPWTLSRRIREQITIPVFLAGGLKPDSVRQAVDEVGSFGLDICTGVRSDGKLDAQKLHAFFTNLDALCA
jgi:phosphoribosylanthranilate isomerase